MLTQSQLDLVAGDGQAKTQPIDRTDLEILFMHFLRYPTFFSDARRLLRPQHFDPAHEADYLVLWLAMCEAVDKHHTLCFTVLVSMINNVVASGAVSITDELHYSLVRQDASGLVYSTLSEPETSFVLAYAETVLKRFMHERLVVFPLRKQLLAHDGRAYPQNLEQLLEQAVRQQQAIQATGSVSAIEMLPDRGVPIPEGPRPRPIGIPFVDANIGGVCGGDINGLIGVTGGFKTTTAVYIATASAQTFFATAPALSVYVSYEQPASRLRSLFISASARIRRATTEQLTNLDTLTTVDCLADYERHMGKPNEPATSEIERYMAARTWMSQCFRFVDYSGHGEGGISPAVGTGYVDELAAELQRLSDQTGLPIGSVVIDWVGAMVERNMALSRDPRDDMLTRLKSFGQLCAERIGGRFHCGVWALHQVRADAGKQSPAILMHHADAMDSKAFATYLANCGCLGTVCKVTGCVRLNWSKTRYKDPKDVRPSILRSNDNFAIMEDVSDRFVISDDGKSLVDRNTYNEAKGTTEQMRNRAERPRRPQAGPSNVPAASVADIEGRLHA